MSIIGWPRPIGIAPSAMLASTPPAVGIFWLVNGILVVDRARLSRAKYDRDTYTHPVSHGECWQEWQALGEAGLAALGFPRAIAGTAYDDWPRGRIVCQMPAVHFLGYWDNGTSGLHQPEIIAALETAFGLNFVSPTRTTPPPRSGRRDGAGSSDLRQR